MLDLVDVDGSGWRKVVGASVVKVIIWGAGGHARVVADVLRLQSGYEIAGFLDDINPKRHGTEFAGGRILGGREELTKLIQQHVRHIIIAIGDCTARDELSGFAVEHGLSLVKALHPASTVARDASIGAGSILAAGSVVNPGCHVGANVIVNTCASVDHDSIIQDAVHIGPGARLAGWVSIGRRSFVGMGSIIGDRVRIGEHCVIGAGSLVLHDVPDNKVVYGAPAKIVRDIS